MAAPDPYLILGVTPTATDEELRAAYRRLAQLHHPDHNHGSRESALRFAEVQEAYAHARLLRKQASATGAAEPTRSGVDPDLDARLAAMEQELRAAREQREKAARAAAQEAARAAAQEHAARRAARARPDRAGERPSEEELGYYTTDDSFTKILDDFADEVAARFSEIHPPRRPGETPRRPRSVADWIDELGSRLTGERPGRTPGESD
ncbi:MAG TPA: J domain-containing protein [Solirubrobacteraceae bacterium]|nr:J domain-containing protein [Solirubrobacteraceae bacterium]